MSEPIACFVSALVGLGAMAGMWFVLHVTGYVVNNFIEKHQETSFFNWGDNFAGGVAFVVWLLMVSVLLVFIAFVLYVAGIIVMGK